MRCDNCGSNTLERQSGPYHYTESGLPNIYLKNVKWARCSKCNDVHVEISRIGQLHRCIASYVVLKNNFLTGPDMVFLRKMLKKTQRAMADDLGISEVSLNRWENENRGHTKAMDTLFRMIYLSLQDDEYTHEANQKIMEAMIRHFGSIKKSNSKPVSVEIDPKTCSVSKVYATLANTASSLPLACI
jgi:putative zinc finger/helix-turn-helix YgiT family protein